MSDRKTEFSNLIVKVIGTKLNKKDDAVRFTYSVENIGELLEKYRKTNSKFECSVVDIPAETSKKHQKIGLEELCIEKEKGTTFYHFALGYVARESEAIKTRNLKKSYKPRTITLEDGEFECSTLFGTIVPSTSKILLDSKCHSSPTSFFLKHVFLQNLDHSPFQINKGDLEGSLRVLISATLKDNYQEVLAEKYKDLSEMAFTLTKPSSKASNVSKDLDVKAADKQVMSAIKSMVSVFMGADEIKSKFEDLPIKRLKLVFSFDDASNKANLDKLKAATKAVVPELVKSEYLSGSVLAYKNDDEDQIQKAFLRGLVRSEPNDLLKKDYLNKSKMWAEQRRVYWQIMNEL